MLAHCALCDLDEISLSRTVQFNIASFPQWKKVHPPISGVPTPQPESSQNNPLSSLPRSSGSVCKHRKRQKKVIFYWISWSDYQRGREDSVCIFPKKFSHIQIMWDFFRAFRKNEITSSVQLQCLQSRGNTITLGVGCPSQEATGTPQPKKMLP